MAPGGQPRRAPPLGRRNGRSPGARRGVGLPPGRSRRGCVRMACPIGVRTTSKTMIARMAIMIKTVVTVGLQGSDGRAYSVCPLTALPISKDRAIRQRDQGPRVRTSLPAVRMPNRR